MRDREADYSSSKSTPTQADLRKPNAKRMQGVTSITLYAVVAITRSCTESNVFAAIRNNTRFIRKLSSIVKASGLQKHGCRHKYLKTSWRSELY